ncbi:MAG TPA: hypothetical protein VFP35_04010 [Candidatus Saccharimonadales bacterium]|nr:hypothetical protein [Candidatus Saccharimonadales bacterium]
MRTVAIIPGWSEGNWHINQFAKALPDGWELASEPDKADIVIAHSSGCYSLPKLGKTNLTILIGPPYDPGRSIFMCIWQNIIGDLPSQLRWWGLAKLVRVRLANCWYALRYPLRHIKIWRSLRQTFLIAVENSETLVIRNNSDAFCSEQIKILVKDYKNIRLVELAGLHEDCWIHPKTYVALLARF